MPRPRPKNPSTHNNDRIASDAIRNIFPKTWKSKPTGDKDSGREVCLDMRWEIVGDYWTGAEFVIQNKNNPRIGKKYVSVDIDVKCVSYMLFDVILPVMIHAYDSKKNNSYWLWLSDWDGVSNPKAWLSQDTVTIQIPLKNKLKTASIKNIEAYVLEYHWKSTTRKQIDIANQMNPDFRFTQPEFREKDVFVVVQPKHDNAKFHFTVNTEGSEALGRTLETGEPTTFKIKSSDFPIPIHSDYTYPRKIDHRLSSANI